MAGEVEPDVELSAQELNDLVMYMDNLGVRDDAVNEEE